MKYQNPNCDGSCPCSEIFREVRVLPTGEDSNAILCFSCYRREITWRKERNKELGKDNQFLLPKWENLNVYSLHVEQVKP